MAEKMVTIQLPEHELIHARRMVDAKAPSYCERLIDAAGRAAGWSPPDELVEFTVRMTRRCANETADLEPSKFNNNERFNASILGARAAGFGTKR